jgi:hypothetical protein
MDNFQSQPRQQTIKTAKTIANKPFQPFLTALKIDFCPPNHPFLTLSIYSAET